MKNIYVMKSKTDQQERVNSAFKYCQELQTFLCHFITTKSTA